MVLCPPSPKIHFLVLLPVNMPSLSLEPSFVFFENLISTRLY